MMTKLWQWLRSGGGGIQGFQDRSLAPTGFVSLSNTKPLIAPAEQAGVRHRCADVCLCACEWVNVKYIVKYLEKTAKQMQSIYV